jgi:ubiquinone/menaquinone biosynthesis C-methylase UbiE
MAVTPSSRDTSHAQAFSVKRAEVEFHNFASLGEPERAIGKYEAENIRRGEVFRNHLPFLGGVTPFLEIGANVGHTSYLLANDYGAQGFALDISADSLRYGIQLQRYWGYERAPIRVAGDALNLPFRDGSMRLVMAFQMLSQFQDIESVFLEVKRVLAPGGVFFFAEEPMRRQLSMRLYRCPYYQNMKPWERKLSDWGLLGYLVRDVIGAHQEESFGIRQNHRMTIRDWHNLVTKHFVSHEYQMFVPERGWGESIPKAIFRKLDRLDSDWLPSRMLGGTLAAFCKKAGTPNNEEFDIQRFETYLRCPDCGGSLRRDEKEVLHCTACTYGAPDEGGVYNLLPSAERAELYPGDRDDIIDFSLPGHAEHLKEGWYELEGIHGNKYRWIGARATVELKRVKEGPQKLRVRGLATETFLTQGGGVQPSVQLIVNGQQAGSWTIDRTGVFILEADVPEASVYKIEILANSVWMVPTDDRKMSVNISMIRLVPRE